MVNVSNLPVDLAEELAFSNDVTDNNKHICLNLVFSGLC